MLSIKKDNSQLHLLTIVLVTFIFYCNSINNFFYADDFIWLNRVKHLPNNWFSIFTIENRYFTPLTYISFFVDYRLFGLNAFWYHLQDVIFHSINGVLLYVFAYKISRNKLTAFLAAILFVTSFSTIITVIWPSARTDLMMVFFSLATIIAFIREDSDKHNFVPVVLYILSLCAKGTALVIPIILFMLTSKTKPFKNRIQGLLPYFTVNVVYVALLAGISFLGPVKVVPTHNVVSVANFFKSLPALIVPERYLSQVDLPVLVSLCAIILVIMIVLVIKIDDITVRIGASLTISGLLPLLFTNEYTLAGNNANAVNFLSSPSNRIYLACAGISLIYAVVAEKASHLGTRLPVRIVPVIVLVSLLYVNYSELDLINKKWKTGTKSVECGVSTLERHASMLTNGSTLLLYNFEGSSGFLTAMMNTLYDLKDIEIHMIWLGYINELTNIDKSPLNNTSGRYNPDRVKLIINCQKSLNGDVLTASVNSKLQDILTDYSNLHKVSTKADTLLIRNQLKENMERLRDMLLSCQFTGE